MYKIVKKELLAPNIYLMNIEAPRVARSARPGQFVIVRLDEHGERVPLTISDYDAEQGWVTIVTQTVGYSTSKLCAMSEGDSLADFAGPLGCPSEFVHEEPERCAAAGSFSWPAASGPLRSIRRSSGCRSAA